MADTQLDPAVPTFGTIWKLRIAAIIWFLLIAGCLLALPTLVDATVLLVIAAALLSFALGAGLAWLYRKFRQASDHGFLHDWLKAALATFCVLCITMAAPVYYFAMRTAADPPLLPRAVLTNGQKTVVFQGMMHIGTQQFYKQVVFDLEQALADGYVLYYEGVQPNPKGDKWFSDTLAGGGDLSANYTALSKLCGLKFQSDYFGLLQADQREHPERHVIGDVDTWQMQQEFERLKRDDPEFAAKIDAELSAKNADQGSGPMNSPVTALNQLTDGQLKLMGYFCRNQASNVIRTEQEPNQLKKVILNFRNQALVRQMLSDPHDKIYVTYGAEHLKGVFALLRKADPRWRIESVTWTTPIAAPQQLEGEL